MNTEDCKPRVTLKDEMVVNLDSRFIERLVDSYGGVFLPIMPRLFRIGLDFNKYTEVSGFYVWHAVTLSPFHAPFLIAGT